MKKNIVFYYSGSGNNRFLAKKISERLNCEIEEIKPRIDSRPLLLLGTSLGIKRIQADISEYERVILVGPIMVGKFLAPLKRFVKNYNSKINKMIFVTCCGSSYEIKDQKFGHGLVFKQVEEIMGDKCIMCQAFPITLVIPEEKREDPNLVMSAKLNDDTFRGEILDRFNGFIQKISA